MPSRVPVQANDLGHEVEPSLDGTTYIASGDGVVPAVVQRHKEVEARIAGERSGIDRQPRFSRILGSGREDVPRAEIPVQEAIPWFGQDLTNAAEHWTSSERCDSGKDRLSADWTRSRSSAPISDSRGRPGGAAIAVSRASNSDRSWNASMSSGMVANDDVASSRSSSIDPVSGSCSSNRTAPLPFQARNAAGSPLNLSQSKKGSTRPCHDSPRSAAAASARRGRRPHAPPARSTRPNRWSQTRRLAIPSVRGVSRPRQVRRRSRGVSLARTT